MMSPEEEDEEEEEEEEEFLENKIEIANFRQHQGVSLKELIQRPVEEKLAKIPDIKERTNVIIRDAASSYLYMQQSHNTSIDNFDSLFTFASTSRRVERMFAKAKKNS